MNLIVVLLNFSKQCIVVIHYLDGWNNLPKLPRQPPSHRNGSKLFIFARVLDGGRHILLDLFQRFLKRPLVRLLLVVRPLRQNLSFDRIEGREHLFPLHVSGDRDVQVFRPVELLVVGANLFDGRACAQVRELAARLRDIAVVAGEKVFDHGEVDNVGRLVFYSLENEFNILLFEKRNKVDNLVEF